MSPCSSQFFSIAVKFFSTVLETNHTVKGAWPVGKLMLESQSKTVNLLQLSVPQVPLFLQPFGEPPSEVEQLVHAIILYIVL
jgi:hypothetical protein